MTKSKSEVFNQYNSLKMTVELFQAIREKILSATKEIDNFVFFGCGSSYALTKSAAAAAQAYGANRAVAIAAGDFILNCECYVKALKDACAVFISRSGRTTEMVMAAEIIRERFPNCLIVSLCSTEESPLCRHSDFNIELPWAFDESVCQTQTVTNLYAASLLLMACRYGDPFPIRQLENLISGGSDFLNRTVDAIKSVCRKKWSHVVVLADAIPSGLAEEGAMAFNELSMIHSNFYHILDVRHGPMTVLDESTLVVVLCSAAGYEKQLSLIHDLQKRGSFVLTIAPDDCFSASDMFIKIPRYMHSLTGIFLINVIQLLALGLAETFGVNPDSPDGLDAWIEL